MNEFWWSLPGPSGFLEQVAEDLRDGKCVVLRLPEHAPDDLQAQVRRQIERDWRRLNAADLEGDPAEALYGYFAPDAPPEDPRSCRTLLTLDRFLGQAVMIDIRCSFHWPAWREFLCEYEERVRAISPALRTILCVVLTGDVADDPPPDGVALVSRAWENAVSEMDTALWTSHLFRSFGSNPTVRRVAASIVTSLSLWDPYVAFRFSSERSEYVFNPASVLEEIGRERGWRPETIPDELWPWCRGMRSVVDGKSRAHSAVLAVTGRREAIGHRVWSGQVSVLFPFVEERRRGLLNGLATKLHVPFRPHPNAEPINDIRDLELSHIYKQLRYRADLPDWLVPAIDTLVGIRNNIAHFDLVPEAYLMDDNLRLLMRSTDYEVQT